MLDPTKMNLHGLHKIHPIGPNNGPRYQYRYRNGPTMTNNYQLDPFHTEKSLPEESLDETESANH